MHTSSTAVDDARPEVPPGPGGDQIPALERELRALFGRLRRWQQHITRVGDLRLDPHTFMLLTTVREHSPLRVQDLAALLGLDASTASRHVKSLEAAGLVERAADPDDRRASLVRISQRGEDAWTADRDTRSALLHQTIESWAPDDRERLTSLLIRLNGELDRLQTDALDPERTNPAPKEPLS
ncbi:MarR family transcriptional regulator [Desertihabitans brevis]|uniref:MarR family transcriptional regulator n=1 Tax=Desertihabitans brevis TaxID=2268447 RepID=A0A367YWK9_9ACTN|nr:MarR family transcriptional regulator [Desertihabitans brevis]RCK69392.1 MarR family transcriptional regulator [Desertihabitans brevis]